MSDDEDIHSDSERVAYRDEDEEEGGGGGGGGGDEEDDDVAATGGAAYGGDDDDDEEEEDEDDDDDDDDEDDGGGRKKKGRKGDKKKKRRRTKYLDVEAQSGDEDEEDELEEEAGYSELKRQRMLDEQNPVYPAKTARRPDFLNYENEEDINRHFSAMRRTTAGAGYDDEEDELLDGGIGRGSAADSMLQPSVSDPRLWRIAVRPGSEQEVVLRLLGKCAAYARNGKPLGIFSAFYNGYTKGAIYVEAFRDVFVKEAVDKLRDIFITKGVKLVPVNETVDCLTVSRARPSMVEGQFVRIKGNVSKGIYKGDLAQVVYKDEARDRVTIRMVPRIDLSKFIADDERDEVDEDEKKTGNKAAGRPPARLFVANKLPREASQNLEQRREGEKVFYMFEGNKIVDGYVEKEVRSTAVQFENIQPTVEELRRFNPKALERAIGGAGGIGGGLGGAGGDEDDDNEDEERERMMEDMGGLMDQSGAANRAQAVFEKGDLVRVRTGQLSNVEGIIDSIEGDTIYIRPQGVDINDVLGFNKDELFKFYPQGTSVKVLRGKHRNKTGMVLRNEGEIVIVLTDVGKQELKLLSSDLQRSSEVTDAIQVLGEFRLFDLVHLESSTSGLIDVGVIIKIHAGTMDIIDNNGTVHNNVMPYGIKRRLNSTNANALDSVGNQLAAEHLVRVKDGIYRGKKGTIRHIFRSYLFLHDPTRTENNGIFVCRPRQCVRMGVTKPGAGNITPGVGATFSNSRARELHPWVGKKARIVAGPYKGQICTVKEAQEFMATVELAINCKKVAVKLAQLREGERNQDHNASGGMGDMSSSSSYANAQTPMWTPHRSVLDAPATPMRDVDGSRTPLRDDAWNPMTPARDDQDYPSATPQSQEPPESPAVTPAIPTPQSNPVDYGAYPTPGNSFGAGGIYAQTPTNYTPRDMLSEYPPSTGAPTPGSASQHLAPTPIEIEPEMTPAWVLPGVVVTIGQQGENGVILEDLRGGMVKVQVGTTEQRVAAAILHPVVPVKNDSVIAIGGQMTGRTGRLIGIDGADGIVKMELDIKILDMARLAKYQQL